MSQEGINSQNLIALKYTMLTDLNRYRETKLTEKLNFTIDTKKSKKVYIARLSLVHTRLTYYYLISGQYDFEM